MVNATLYLLHYNNYYNRVYKAESSLEGYLQYQLGQPIHNINFIPNDYVNTTQIINWQYENLPDYLLVVDEDQNIVSKWFIISNNRLREGQYELELHRDLVSDYYLPIVNAPMFIEKATLQDSSPFIYNKEDMTFNQIKLGEQLLQDETKSAWIVGYCTSKTEDESGNPLEISADFNAAVGANEAIEGIATWKYYKYSNLASAKEDLAGYPSQVSYCIYAKTDETVPSIYKVCFNEAGGQPCGEVQKGLAGETINPTGYGDTSLSYADSWNPNCTNTSLLLALLDTGKFTDVSAWVTAFKSHFSALKGSLNNYLPIVSEEDTIELNSQNGKILYDSSTKKYYRVAVTKEESVWSETPIVSGNMYNTFLTGYNQRANNYDTEFSFRYEGEWKAEVMNGTDPNSNTFAIRTFGAKYNVTLTELTDYVNPSYNITLGTSRYHLNDAPYDMFAIPYSDDLVIYKNRQELFKADKMLAFQAVMALVRKYQAAGYIYDVQLLPFCPVRSMILKDNSFDVGDNVVDYITFREQSGATVIPRNVGIVIYASNSSTTFNIPCKISYNNKKIAAMCDKYRLCSPNYNGQFEFNAAMNNGVEYFNVDVTYKPYTPYIHINPNYGGLYGQDYNDSRGLICGGEFSLPAVSNNWDTYELQNKNYQNIFDREIQNMEVNNAVQKEREMWGIAGTAIKGMGGTAAGVVGGLKKGGVAGGIVGGVTGTVGTAFGLASSIRSSQLNEKLRNETLDYKRDMFGYQLGNIQALPYALTRTTAFTYNNKIFPILEYYSCTDQEKRALANKIAYNGMTVMTIGTINDYINNSWQYEDITSKGYIKGKLIRTEDIEDDFHICNAIAEELDKGVFM